MYTAEGRPEAAAEIWRWQAAEAPEALGTGTRARAARIRGGLQALAGAAIGAAILVFLSRTAGTIVLSIASLVALCALLSPLGAFAAIERGVAALGRGVGRVLTWLTLPAIFYAFFVPFAALLRRGRRDAMKRYFDPGAASYWTLREAREPAGDDERRRRYRP